MREETVEAVRRFSRFYTQRLEVLDEGILKSPFSLGEVRTLYEIAHGQPASAADLARALGVDPGYLSRTLRGLERRGLIRREPGARKMSLALTKDGTDAVRTLESASVEQLRGLLSHLDTCGEDALRKALRSAERLMRPDSVARPIVLRPPRPGEYGWVVQRHGAIYAAEYRWDETFEALVAEIVAAYIRDHDSARERVFVGELDGEPAGAIFLVRQDDTTAKLRLLFVESWARGSGLGGALVHAVIAEARALGYCKLVLWTNDCLHAARKIYERTGFRLVESAPHRSFGHDLIGETWELDL